MSPDVRGFENITEFFRSIEPHLAAYSAISFGYLAIRHDDEFLIVQGRLTLNTGFNKEPFTQFQSENIRAGVYSLATLGTDAHKLVDQLMAGRVSTPDGALRFLPNEGGHFAAVYDPLHEAGQKAQSRMEILWLLGGSAEADIRQPTLDWELKASPTPYDNLQELAYEYSLGVLSNIVNVEVVAFYVAAVDGESVVSGETARLGLKLALGIPTESATVGYRLFAQGRVVRRSAFGGQALRWEQKDGYQHGTIEVEVPAAAVLHCVASYRGIAQHHFWVSDPTTSSNARRAVYELFDSKLDVLTEFLLNSQGRGRNARELESGVAWLLWMLGFSVAHFGATPRTQDAADLIAVTPGGHFAVIECTTGLLKADNKLPLLVARAENVRRRLNESGNRHLRVLPVIINSKTQAEIRADVEQAERLSILVITREGLEQSALRTLTVGNADQIFEQGGQAVQAAAGKYEANLL